MGSAGEKWARRVVWTLIFIGIFLRANRYLHNFPFWGDEAWVAQELMLCSFRDIFLNLHQTDTLPSPAVGFLLLQKTVITLFGLKEMAFRFFPCLCGVASIFVFRRLLKGLVSPRAALMALAGFVFSDLLIFYSSELKQYSVDILFVTLALVFHRRALKYSMDHKETLGLALVGGIGLAFSLPLILVLCGIALAQVYVFYQSRSYRERVRYLLVLSVWLAFFLCLWVNYYHINFVGKEVLGYQRPYYLSWPGTPGGWGAWSRKLFSAFSSPVEFTLPWLSALMFGAGCWSLWLKNRVLMLSLVAPVLLTVVLSALDKYPFHGRFLIFLLPVFFILIAQGVDQVMAGRKWRSILGLVIASALLAQPVVQAGNYVFPSGMSDIRSLMLYMRDRQRPDDGLYMNNDTQWGYYVYHVMLAVPMLRTKAILYEHASAFDKPGQLFCIVSPDRSVWGTVYSWDRVLDSRGQTIRMPGSGRTWILLSQVGGKAKEKLFIDLFDTFGERLDERHSNNAALYLYDLK